MTTERNDNSNIKELKSEDETSVKINNNVENISFLNHKKRLNR